MARCYSNWNTIRETISPSKDGREMANFIQPSREDLSIKMLPSRILDLLSDLFPRRDAFPDRIVALHSPGTTLASVLRLYFYPWNVYL